MSDIDLGAVAERAGDIEHSRIVARRRAKTEALATILADAKELLDKDPKHPLAAVGAALFSGQASAEDIVIALRAIYGDAAVDAAYSDRPSNVIPGTAEERYPIIEADGRENGNVAVNDAQARSELESRGYRLTRDGTRWVYKKQEPAPADPLTRALPPTPVPIGDFPLYDKHGRRQVGTISPTDAARRTQQGELVEITDQGGHVTGYRYSKFWER